MNTLQHVVLTSDLPWDPTLYNDEEDYKSDDDEENEDDLFDLNNLEQGLDLGLISDGDYEQTLA